MALFVETKHRLTQKEFVTSRKRLLQMHYESGVGHIGGNLSALDAMLIIFHEYLSPADAFILSKGHAAGALYVALWSTGQLTDADLKTFHQDDTRLPAHPPAFGIERISFMTGSLGHGLSLAAGTALGNRLRKSDARVFCLLSDGEWQEGSTWEALIFAAHHHFENLTVLVDHNELQGFGTTAEVASMTPLWERLAGFDVAIEVIDGHDGQAIRAALERRVDRLRIIVLQTTKGKGVDFMENQLAWHYLPLTESQFISATAQLERE